VGVPQPSLGYWAVVTGASQGIGKAMATVLAARGHNLIITARRQTVLDELAAQLTSRYGVAVDVRAADLADPDERGRFADELSSRDISILCANAGGTDAASGLTSVVMRGPAALETEVQLNVLGVHDLVLAVLPGMLSRRAGGILVSGSVAGNSPIPFCATYAASKAFANTFTESLHGELSGTGVNVTVLAPGRVRSSWIPGCVWTSAKHSARVSLDGLARNKMRVVPGLHAKAVSVASGYPPRAMVSAAWSRILDR
jgi:short-subunit dehydrogenase